MCIFVFSTSCKQYPFILISNRDEYFKRQTQSASHHTYQDHHVICPIDSERHGTWLAVNLDTNKVSVLVNYRERTRILSEGVNNISRGILPLEAITTTTRAGGDFINELTMKYHNDELLQNIGGFSLFYGDLVSRKFDIISNKSKDDFKIFNEYDNPEVKTYGLSNSAFDDPWPKVKVAEGLLKTRIEEFEGNPVEKDQFIKELLDILSISSIDGTKPYVDNYDEIPNTVFVPPLKTDTVVENQFQGKYYGTRTQTVILVDKDNKLTFVERNLHSSDDLSEAPKITKYESKLKDN